MSNAETITEPIVSLPENPETAASDALYGVSRWGDGLIGVLNNGNIGLMHPDRPDAVPTDLMSVIENLRGARYLGSGSAAGCRFYQLAHRPDKYGVQCRD